MGIIGTPGVFLSGAARRVTREALEGGLLPAEPLTPRLLGGQQDGKGGGNGFGGVAWRRGGWIRGQGDPGWVLEPFSDTTP